MVVYKPVDMRNRMSDFDKIEQIRIIANTMATWSGPVDSKAFRDYGRKILEILEFEEDEIDESMDGYHASALASVGWGTDEDYGYADEVL